MTSPNSGSLAGVAPAMSQLDVRGAVKAPVRDGYDVVNGRAEPRVAWNAGVNGFAAELADPAVPFEDIQRHDAGSWYTCRHEAVIPAALVGASQLSLLCGRQELDSPQVQKWVTMASPTSEVDPAPTTTGRRLGAIVHRASRRLALQRYEVGTALVPCLVVAATQAAVQTRPPATVYGAAGKCSHVSPAPASVVLTAHSPARAPLVASAHGARDIQRASLQLQHVAPPSSHRRTQPTKAMRQRGMA